MRLFIGIRIPNQIKECLVEIQKRVLLGTIKSKQTRFDNFHITLLFLGEVDTNHIDEIIDHLESVAHLIKPFSVSLSGLGHFAKKNDVVLWVGIQKGLNELTRLANQTRIQLKTFRSNANQSYSPHVTLARGVSFNMIQHDIEIPMFHMEFEVSEIILYQSTRIHDVLTYVELHSTELKKQNK
jgi:RNA 2',3'-cyclic 3'-phosphodiesterase